MARLIKMVKDAGPRVVALDIIFAEKEGPGAVTSLRQEFTRKGVTSPDILGLLAQEETAGRRGSPTGQGHQGRPAHHPGLLLPGGGGDRRGRDPGEARWAPTSSRLPLITWCAPWITSSSRCPSSAPPGWKSTSRRSSRPRPGNGYFNMVPDVDGTIRWFPLTILYGSDFFAPESLVALDHYRGARPWPSPCPAWGWRRFAWAGRTSRWTATAGFSINYLGPAGTIPTYSAAALLDGSLPARVL